MAMYIGLVGAVVTVTIFVATAIWQAAYRVGRHEHRLDELERWRGTIRQDFHEVSDLLESVRIELRHLGTVVDERVTRRDGA